jgi:hypothetical protein
VRTVLTLAAAAGITAAAALAATPASAAAPASARGVPGVYSGRSCSAPLSYGHALVTRQTGYVGAGRYWTSMTMVSTGDEFRLVTDRLEGIGSRGTMIRRARGITGTVNTSRSWGAHSRTPNMRAVVRGVDKITGKYFAITC